MSENKNVKENKKWEFEDWAFLVTGIIVGFLLIVPDILYAQFDIIFLGGSLGDESDTLLSIGEQYWNINSLRAVSPLLFLLTTTIVFFYEAIHARKNGGYEGSVFTHTFESLLEDALYMAITTIMVYAAVFAGAMYISWLAGPISWILFVFIFPFVRRKSTRSSEETQMPWLLLLIFAAGLITELLTMQWIAFPLSWLVICAIKLIETIREGVHTVDTVFDVLYYSFSIMLMAVGVGFDFWIASWAAFPIAMFICWVLSKFGKFKKVKKVTDAKEE